MFLSWLTSFLIVILALMNSSTLRGQNSDQWTLEGIIIIPSYNYIPDSIPKPDIPQDVLIIPCDCKHQSNMKEAIENCLAEKIELGYLIYFQAIRWTQPEIQNILDKIDKTTISIKNIHGPRLNPFSSQISVSKLIFGKIIFDRKNNKLRDWNTDSEIYQLQVTIFNKIIEIDYVECPKEFGVPKFFSPFEPK